MKLKLVLPQTGQSWTLKPGRDYTVGTGSDCEISLPHDGGLSAHHMMFVYDEHNELWLVRDISHDGGVYINNERAHEYPIKSRLRINLAHRVDFEVVPEETFAMASTGSPTVPAPPQFPTTYRVKEILPPQPPHHSVSRAYSQQYSSNQRSYGFQQEPQLSSLPVLSWRDYIRTQMARKQKGPESLATWFYMTTGFRETPWVKSANAIGTDRNNFNSFEGYVIPDFKGSVEPIITAIEEELGKVEHYRDTYCYVAKLTDAHIVDTASQSFLGVELFPVHRSDDPFPKGDFRRFCVAAYHRVRTYLLVEKYGSDLFVSWITRYEPEPSFIPMMIWLILAACLSVSGIAAQSLPMFLLPLVLWAEYFLLTPVLMQGIEVLPKAANARLINLLIMPITLIVMFSWIGINLMSSF